MNKGIYFFLLLVFSFFAKAQHNNNATPSPEQALYNDSVLSEAAFLAIVVNYHPVAKQAQLTEMQGEALLRRSRGGFDPKLYFDYLDKKFNDKNYFDLAQAGLKIPTWYGLEFKTGWEYGYGANINPEDYTPMEGLGYAGVTADLQGIIMDKRRSDLRQAQQFLLMAENDRDNLLNDLLRDAIFQYWEWAATHQNILILRNTLKNSLERYEGIRQSFYYGELSVLDTLEAFTQIQAIETDFLEVQADFVQETMELNVFLWGPDLVPLEIGYLVPEKIDNKINSVAFTSNFNTADSVIVNHPLIQSYQANLRALEIERKFKSNQLLPDLKVQYNFLTTGYYLAPREYNTNNYKWSVNLNFPLFLRKERGDLKLTKIKIEQQQLKIDLKQQELIAKTASYKAKADALSKQTEAYKNAAKGYETLLRQEERMLASGESSIFRLTMREIKMLEANLKLIQLNLKYVKAKTDYIHSSGALHTLQ